MTSLTSKPSTLASVDVLWAIRVPCDGCLTWITFVIRVIFAEVLESSGAFKLLPQCAHVCRLARMAPHLPCGMQRFVSMLRVLHRALPG